MNHSRDTDNISFRKFYRADELSCDWDFLAESYFQKKKFLHHTDIYNPCGQRYYELYADGKFLGGAIVFTLLLNLLTFTKNFSANFKVNVICTPASVSCSGLIGTAKYQQLLVNHLLRKENGFILGLNTDTKNNFHPAVTMKALPTVIMKHQFKSWDNYLYTLRSIYRRRLKLIQEKFHTIKAVETDCSRFDEKIYECYMQILKKTKTKLETLSLEFFKNLPEEFRLTTYHLKDEILSWHVNLIEGDRLTFFFGGTNYKYNKHYDAYFNNLTGVLSEAIKLNCTEIDFGQTAEIPKLRLGGKIAARNMFLFNSNYIVRFLITMSKGIIQYNRELPDHRVFHKTKDHEDSFYTT